MSDLENLSFQHTKYGTNYWKKLRSQGLTHMGTASLHGNGLARKRKSCKTLEGNGSSRFG